MARFANTAAQLPRLLFARGEDLRSDAARAIGQVLAIKSAGSPGAAAELTAFFAGCSALLSGAAPGKTATVTDGQTFTVGTQTLTAHVTGGVLTFTIV